MDLLARFSSASNAWLLRRSVSERGSPTAGFRMRAAAVTRYDPISSAVARRILRWTLLVPPVIVGALGMCSGYTGNLRYPRRNMFSAHA